MHDVRIDGRLPVDHGVPSESPGRVGDTLERITRRALHSAPADSRGSRHMPPPMLARRERKEVFKEILLLAVDIVDELKEALQSQAREPSYGDPVLAR